IAAMNRKVLSPLVVAAAGLSPVVARADAISTAGGTKSSFDPIAVGMFVLFVVLSLGITYWAAQRTRTTKDFYAAGGGITGFQNGLAIAGDNKSADSFLGITALVY